MMFLKVLSEMYLIDVSLALIRLALNLDLDAENHTHKHYVALDSAHRRKERR